MLQVGQSSINAIWRHLNRLDWSTGLRGGRLGEGVLSVDKSVSARTTLDFSKTNEVTTLKVSVAVLELPESCFGVAGMEYVSF